jgi:transposase-like protein
MDTSNKTSFQVSAQIIDQYRQDGSSWSSIAQFLGVSTNTLQKWIDDNQYEVRQ